MFTNFEYIKFFSCLNKRNIFYEWPISIKQLWFEVIPTEYCYIYYIYNTDGLGAPFFSIISSQGCFVEMDLSWKMFLLLRHEKNVRYSRLVINPFKHNCIECANRIQNWTVSLKGLFTNFEYITFFSCLNKRNIFHERPISIKNL